MPFKQIQILFLIPSQIKLRPYGHETETYSQSLFLIAQVSVNDGKETYVFPCNRWLAEDEGDGKIQVELWTGEAADEPSGQGTDFSFFDTL